LRGSLQLMNVCFVSRNEQSTNHLKRVIVLKQPKISFSSGFWTFNI